MFVWAWIPNDTNAEMINPVSLSPNVLVGSCMRAS